MIIVSLPQIIMHTGINGFLYNLIVLLILKAIIFVLVLTISMVNLSLLLILLC